jgi:hypothetical protein
VATPAPQVDAETPSGDADAPVSPTWVAATPCNPASAPGVPPVTSLTVTGCVETAGSTPFTGPTTGTFVLPVPDVPMLGFCELTATDGCWVLTPALTGTEPCVGPAPVRLADTFAPDGAGVLETAALPTGVEADAPNGGPTAIATPARPTTRVAAPAVAMTIRMTCADRGPAPKPGDMGYNLHTQPLTPGFGRTRSSYLMCLTHDRCVLIGFRRSGKPSAEVSIVFPRS